MTEAPFHKRILVDSNFLIVNASPRTSEDDRARIDHLFKRAEKAKTKIILPMPGIAEYLVHADEAALQSLAILERKSFIYVAPFDRMSAFECALIDRAAIGAGDKKDGSLEPWQKIKVDRQIVGIGRAHGVTLIISHDKGLRSNALRLGIECLRISELELPESAKQRPLFKAQKK